MPERLSEYGAHERLAFADGVRERLLHVDVLAGLGRSDTVAGVPEVRGRNAHPVDVLAPAAEVVPVLTPL